MWWMSKGKYKIYCGLDWYIVGLVLFCLIYLGSLIGGYDLDLVF